MKKLLVTGVFVTTVTASLAGAASVGSRITEKKQPIKIKIYRSPTGRLEGSHARTVHLLDQAFADQGRGRTRKIVVNENMLQIFNREGYNPIFLGTSFNRSNSQVDREPLYKAAQQAYNFIPAGAEVEIIDITKEAFEALTNPEGPIADK